ncbi:hypothetical protein EVAR_53602_1 [Eumeta japonica]|uniref:Uncharacterized protein n=1 Tax=Eumeta variegata TaxID=151549 RepID=A0A4C1WYU0_EUMVA|nr:hypothetical protein EVAR_53602_1 [Eumeta japonica]
MFRTLPPLLIISNDQWRVIPLCRGADKKPVSELFRYALAANISITLVPRIVDAPPAPPAPKDYRAARRRDFDSCRRADGWRTPNALRSRDRSLCLNNSSRRRHEITAYMRRRRWRSAGAVRLGAIKLMKRGDGTILLVLFVSCRVGPERMSISSVLTC